jgi:nicotinamide riboside transporter PnuC
MIDHLAQVGILAFGSTSLLMVARNNKWGFVHGLISQFFFIISSVINKQTGVFLLSFIEIFLWTYGIYNWFLKGKLSKHS